MDFHEVEQKDGIRFSWNQWPHNKIGATRISMPIGCLYTPLKEMDEQQPMEYPPVQCSNANCKAILNPYAPIDFRMK